MKDSSKKNITKWFWIIITAPFALVFLMLLLVWMFAKIPSFEELEHPDSKLATQVLSDDGQILTTFHIENRTFVSYEELSPYLVHAAIATEDSRFYRHSGIDTKGLARVFFKTLLMRDSSQGGGSTITQQLAKSLYPRKEVQNRLWGKVVMVWTKFKEWITAVKLERNYTKEEIVDMYLNSVFFGSSAYGIRAASETFFDKLPSEVTVEEAATLIGMVNKPTRYNPAINPDKALVRRNFVLGRMAQNSYKKKGLVLPREKLDSLQALPITLNFQVRDHNAGLAPYFRDLLRRELGAQKPRRSSYQYEEDYAYDAERWEQDDFYGWLNKNRKPNGEPYDLDRDGLRIYTTINYRMQKYAEEAVTEWLGGNLQKNFDRELRWKHHPPFANDVEPSVRERLMSNARRWSDRYRLQRKAGKPEEEILAQFREKVPMRVFAYNKKGYVDTTMTPDDSIRYYKGILRCGFVAMEPGTGFVKAYVGGPNYRWFKYDNVSQGKRQVGSTIKPFLYTLAMQEGMSPCDRTVCVPQSFLATDGTEWTPRSTDKDEWIGKSVTLKWGLTHSSNNISAYLMKQFGPHAMAEMMHKMGIHSHVDEVYALCVGPADLSPYEMVAAYNTFPSKGVYISPMFVTRIEDADGNVLGEFTNRKREAIGERTAYLMANLMEGVVNHGTAYRLRGTYKLGGDIAGKTGTTNDNSDGWFIGYTPSITAGVWVGGEDRQVHFNSIALGGGANMALPIWGIWMKKCLADRSLGFDESDVFTAPAGMTLDLSCTGDELTDAVETTESPEEYYFE